MIKTLKKTLAVAAALLFSTAIYAQTLPGLSATAGVTYFSKIVEKGQVVDNANTVANVTVGFGSFQFEGRGYYPTQLGQKSKIELQRVEVQGTYAFASTFGNLSAGATYKHYNNVVKGAQLDHFEPLVRFDNKTFIPVYVQSKYQIDTRQVNIEGGANLPVDIGVGLKLVPSVYVGYNDISDQFPQSKKAIKLDNRYYGVGVQVVKAVWRGELSAGIHQNRTEHAFANHANYWNAGYSVKF